MRRIALSLAAAAVVAQAAPAIAGAGNFAIVNGTGQPISSVAIRRALTSDWRPLSAAPAAGQRASVQFTDDDCAFDIRAQVAGAGEVVWSGVNLCEAKAVILNRNANGAAWVDYE